MLRTSEPVHFIPYVVNVEVHFLVEIDFHFSFAPSVMKNV